MAATFHSSETQGQFLCCFLQGDILKVAQLYHTSIGLWEAGYSLADEPFALRRVIRGGHSSDLPRKSFFLPFCLGTRKRVAAAPKPSECFIWGPQELRSCIEHSGEQMNEQKFLLWFHRNRENVGAGRRVFARSWARQ
jgi:hypothetical protein